MVNLNVISMPNKKVTCVLHFRHYDMGRAVTMAYFTSYEPEMFTFLNAMQYFSLQTTEIPFESRGNPYDLATNFL